jgi:ribosome-binding protein aMBF1 (putative translation factor)
VVNFDRAKFTTTIFRVPAGRARRENSRFREEAEVLAARLRALRTDRGLTQEQLASRAQVAVSTLRKIESGRVVEPGYFTMLALVKALGIDLHELT